MDSSGVFVVEAQESARQNSSFDDRKSFAGDQDELYAAVNSDLDVNITPIPDAERCCGKLSSFW